MAIMVRIMAIRVCIMSAESLHYPCQHRLNAEPIVYNTGPSVYNTNMNLHYAFITVMSALCTTESALCIPYRV